ncbi:hypothetical protein [Paenibacillus sp. YYML68]|uniref:hypothetical protein n=1 Tax=Paenibacillus sp. YYML68 TaxID=2909250 RepID=UPI0024928B24|nr:hypothetical protein [Paenibacillus sp. YYML68]
MAQKLIVCLTLFVALLASSSYLERQEKPHHYSSEAFRTLSDHSVNGMQEGAENRSAHATFQPREYVRIVKRMY